LASSDRPSSPTTFIPFLLAPEGPDSPLPDAVNSFFTFHPNDMQQQLSKDLASINNFNFVEYLHILGIDPIAIRPGESDYKSPFSGNGQDIMTVNHATNRFEDVHNELSGTLADFVCRMFGCSPEELCADVVRYWLYLVKTKIAAHS
jgi:hypothetical protein